MIYNLFPLPEQVILGQVTLPNVSYKALTSSKHISTPCLPFPY